MSTMILFDKIGNNWNSLGLGPLSESINPTVTRERNGIYSLSFQYPIKGLLFNELKIGHWIVSDSGPTARTQAQQFEIETITKPIDGIVTVYCEHYRYQLLRSIVKVASPLTNVPAQTALNWLQSSMLPKGGFTFYSDITTRSSIDLSDPSKFKNAQEVLGGVQGSILDNFGGEYVFDNNQVRLLASAGKDSNVVIAYGKNLTDITQEENIANTYTSVYGWAKQQETETIITLPEVYLDSDYVGNYSERRILMVDFSDDEPKDSAALRNLVKSYIKNNDIGIPKVSIKTSFVDLASSVLSEDLKAVEQLDLCDTVSITFNDLGINTTAKIIKTIWNVSLDKYDSVELGESQTDFGKVMADSEKKTSQVIKKVDWLEKAQEEASNILKNPPEGHVVIYPSLADPQEILILDTKNVNTAKNVWRWNAGGLGFSSKGYNGTYGLAMTNNGAIVADRMTTGVLRAIKIIGVSISGSTFETLGSDGKILIHDGEIEFFNDDKKSFGHIYPKNENSTGNGYGHLSMNIQSDEGIYLRTGEGNNNQGNYIYIPKSNEKLSLQSNYGFDLQQRVNGKYYGVSMEQGDLTLVSMAPIEMYSSAKLFGSLYTEGLTIPNNKSINFYSPLYMNGYSIYNQSDIRLKENIEDTSIDGIAELKKLNFVEFDRKQFYKNKDSKEQPNSKRELGLIAQYSPFLAVNEGEDNYLSIDVNKQIMLNSLASKQLAEKVEEQEKRIKRLEELLLEKEGETNGE